MKRWMKWTAIVLTAVLLGGTPVCAAHIECVTESDEYEQFAGDFSKYREKSLDSRDEETQLENTYRQYHDFGKTSIFTLPDDATIEEIEALLDYDWITEHPTCTESFSMGTYEDHWTSTSFTDGEPTETVVEIEELLGERGEQAKKILYVQGSARPEGHTGASFAILENADSSVSVVMLTDKPFYNDNIRQGDEFTFAEMKTLMANSGDSAKYFLSSVKPVHWAVIILIVVGGGFAVFYPVRKNKRRG